MCDCQKKKAAKKAAGSKTNPKPMKKATKKGK